MRKFTLLALLLVTSIVTAAPITREAAMQHAQEFLSKKHPSNGRHALRSATLDRSLREAVADAYYVFNVGDNGGFVIVSGDDRSAPILGYADCGSFDSESLPVSVKAWLASYADQLRNIDVINTPVSATRPQKAARRVKAKYSIAPLVQTEWDQEAPYNNACPEFFDLGTSFTGCVATAMAQVMNFHQWPAATTTDLPSYQCRTTWTSYGNVTVPAIPAGTVLEWDKMKNSYTANDEDVDACNAVATLMAACGSSVEMDYANRAGGGSNAAITRAADALVTYFDYSGSAKKVYREDYSYATWLDMIYTELEASRPVLYGGQSSGGGHAFVIDGYDGEGMFHINWGWGGYCNGYFLLSVANPGSNTGAGASDTKDGYSYGQEAVIGIKKQDGETAAVGIIQMTTTEFSVDGTILHASMYNQTGSTYTFDLGFAFIDNLGNLTNPQWVIQNFTLDDSTGPKNGFIFDVNSLGLERGTYRMVPVSKQTHEEDVHCSFNYSKEYALIDVQLSTTTVEMVHPDANLAIADFTVVGKAKQCRNTQINVNIQNKGDEFYGELYLCEGSTLMARVGATIPAGLTSSVTFYYIPVNAGTNNLSVALDAAGTNVIGSISVPVASSSGSSVLAVNGITYDNGDDRYVYGNLSGTMSVTNSGTADYDGEMLFMTMYSEDHQHFSTLKNTYLEVSIPAGSTVDVPFDIDGLSFNFDYVPNIYVGNDPIYFDWVALRTLKAGVITYLADGTKTATAPSNMVAVDANAVAVDLTGTGVTGVTGGNTNTVYFVGPDDAAPAGVTRNLVKDGVTEQLVLNSNYPFFTPFDFTAKYVRFTRTFDNAYTDNGGWSTIALPFTVTSIMATVGGEARLLQCAKNIDDTGKPLLVLSFDREENDILHFDFINEFEGYHPYLISVTEQSLVGAPVTFSGNDAYITSNFKASVTGDLFSLRSTLRPLQDRNIYTLDNEGKQFDQHYSLTNISPFSFYIVPVGADYARLKIAIPDTTVNLCTLPTASQKTPVWYNLNGQRVSKPNRGIYVRGGKTVVVH